jgi:hypothetical protein
MTAVLTVTVILALFSFPAWDTSRRLRIKRKELDLMIASSLSTLDKIIGDKHYLGSECEVVKTFRWKGGRVRHGYYSQRFFPSAKQLCRTKRGSWFLFDPATCGVDPCEEKDARRRLSDDYELYSKTFGKPDVA